MNALITGGGGFLGSHLAETLLNQGANVICVDNFATGLRRNRNYLENLKDAKQRLTFIEADVIRDWSTWAPKAPQNFETIFHFASPASPPHYQRLGLETLWVNSIGLSNALNYADQFGARVVFASTSEVYGDPAISPQPETYWGNVNSFGARACYDEAKRFGEALIYTHNQKYKTKHGLVRIFNTYGPRMNPNDGRVIINFLVQALESKNLTVYGNGKQTRSFCYVDDLVAGILRYAKSDVCQPVNLGNDTEFSILEAAEIVQDLFKSQNLKIEFQDLPADDPRQRRPNLTEAKKLLSPWQPQVPLREGLKKTLDWLKEEGLSK